MKHRNLKYSSLSLAIALGMAAPAAFAQDASEPAPANPSSTTSLDTITVTARKREETLQEVPVAVTAFTPETLEKLNVQDLGDLGAQVPNLTVYAARGSSSTVTAYIRGIGQADPLWGVDPGVGIYLDDVYIARPQGALLDVFDVERIEVLRGPQGTLYGKNTIGGAIKYISRGLPKQTDGFASVTVGNHSQLDVKAAIGGPIGGSEALRARVSVASLNRDGYGENLHSGQQVSDKEILAARAQLGAYVNDDLDIQFAIDWMDDQSGVRGGKMLAPNPLDYVIDPGRGFGQQPLDNRYDIRSGMPNVNDTSMLGMSATVNWRVNEDWALKYVVAKRESDTETNIDFDMLPNRIVDVLAFYSDEQVSNEFQVNYDAGGRVRGVVGLYAFDGEAGGQVLNNFLNASFGDTRGTVYTESLSLYTDWTIDLTDRFKLDLGARYTDEDKHAVVLNRAYSSADFDTVIAVPADFDKTVNFSNVSPKISLGYQVNDDVLVYGLASRGFKSGGYNIRANSAVPHTLLPFDDESVDSFEIGAKLGLLDQRLFLNLAAFHNKYDDIQLSVFTGYDSNGDGVDDAFLGDFTNAGKGTVNGVEVEYQWLPTEHWLISGNLAWLDAKYDEFISAGTNVADSQVFTNAPEFSGAVNVEWRTDLANGGNLSARVSYAYQSEVYPTTDLSEDIKQDGYGLVNAGVIWRMNDAWSFSLQGTNLADKEYRTTGYNIAALGILTGFYGPPRQYSLTARYDF
ncbi:TonB-dependent receptor [Luteimonas marina]|uniref:TonB-dependent receptor n=1 Tax=Luteimonas marina TaxID=488485 RepID=A0A5C5UAY7_9GAMM|nr:TonB-dependent receptor [Luteimonas marina]TWT23274.1 TonB-dependent receptor [Luteimonas marina]